MSRPATDIRVSEPYRSERGTTTEMMRREPDEYPADKENDTDEPIA
jgi:hypothetical protein